MPLTHIGFRFQCWNTELDFSNFITDVNFGKFTQFYLQTVYLQQNIGWKSF
jgi:hypothetical protein